MKQVGIELVFNKWNHLKTILHVYAGGLIVIKWKKNIIHQKEKGNTFTLLIIFLVKSLQKEQNT